MNLREQVTEAVFRHEMGQCPCSVGTPDRCGGALFIELIGRIFYDYVHIGKGVTS